MMNSKLQQNRSFFNHWAQNYDWPLFQFWMKRFQVPALKQIQFFPGLKILDLSCGTGELLKSLQQRYPSAQLYGVDISPKMLVAARRKVGKKVKLFQADVVHLPFRQDSFDYVLSTEAFHHYYDQQKALREMARVVRKGGQVIIVDVHFFLPLIHRLFEWLEPGCVKINNRAEIKALFLKAGLRDIQQQRNFLFAVMTTGKNKAFQAREGTLSAQNKPSYHSKILT